MRLSQPIRVLAIALLVLAALVAAGFTAKWSWDSTSGSQQVTVESFIANSDGTFTYSSGAGYCSHNTELDGGIKCYTVQKSVPYTVAERLAHVVFFAGISLLAGLGIVHLLFCRRPRTVVSNDQTKALAPTE